MPFEVMGEITGKRATGAAMRTGLGAVAGWAELQAEVECSLLALRCTHLRVSLFAVGLGTQSRAGGAVARALAALGPVGRLPDGSLGLLYLGPRPCGISSEAPLVETVRRRVQAALGGAERHGVQPLIAAVHAWSDELAGVGALLQLLLAWETPLHLADLAAA
mgnify:FL=1